MLISGPIELKVYHSAKYNHYIYIFGDIHEDINYLCANKKNLVWMLLDDIFKKNPDLFFNLYVEIHQINDEKDGLKGYSKDVLYEIINFFNSFSKIKRNKYDNAMIHYVDYRAMLVHLYNSNHIYRHNSAYIFFHAIDSLENLMFHNIMSKEKKKHINEIKYYLSLLKDNFSINTSIDYGEIYIQYIKDTKIYKQYHNIKDVTVHEKLLKIFNTLLNKLTHAYKSAFDLRYIIKNINRADRKTQKQMSNFYEYNMIMQNYVMDMYSIGRILRDYKETDQNPNPRYSFVYVGKYHSSMYETILTNHIGYNRIYKSTPTDKLRCINISDKAFAQFNL